MNLGKSLEIALIKKGIKKKDLAVQMEVKPQQVTQWVRGSISKSHLVNICDFLEMPVSEFIALGE